MMIRVLIVTLLALIVNLWVADGSAPDDDLLLWAIRRLMPLTCGAAIVAITSAWRRDTIAGRVLWRISSVTLIACLLTVAPFVIRDLTQFAVKELTGVEIHIPAERFTARALLSFGANELKASQEQQRGLYDAAVNACMEEKRRAKLALSENARRFECVTNASRIGASAFVAHYSQAKLAETH